MQSDQGLYCLPAGSVSTVEQDTLYVLYVQFISHMLEDNFLLAIVHGLLHFEKEQI